MAVNNRVKITNDIELKDRLVAINRVTKVTKGGRTFSFSAIVVVGNEDGVGKIERIIQPSQLGKSYYFSFGRDERCPYGCSEQRRKYGKSI